MSQDPKIGDYRLRAEWDIDKGDFEYILEVYTDIKWGSFAGPPPKVDPYWGQRATSFDKDWADRTAKHFNLKIEGLDNE